MRKELDFTNGSISGKLIKFSIPLLVGNLLQQGYFVADTVVVGRLIGKNALAAISSGTIITTLLIYLFQGVAAGVGIIISHSVGSGKTKSIKDIIKAATIFTGVLGGTLSIASFIFVGRILRLISVPEEIFNDTKLYLSIALLGILPLLLYNMGSNIIQSMGDAKTPLIYLALACVINIGLDIIFVNNFHMGVEGTAIATVIALSIVSLLIAFDIKKRIDSFEKKSDRKILTDMSKMSLEGIEFDESEKLGNSRHISINDELENIKSIFMKIIKIGMPIGVQSIVINLSNVFVQNHINGIGTSASAAWGVFGRLDTFIILPFLSIRLAITTFVGQNYGAKKINRIFQGIKVGTWLSILVTGGCSLVGCIFAGQIINIFTTDKEIISIAMDMVWHMIPFYVIMSISSAYTGGISGTGNSTVPMVINIVFMCLVRIISIPIFTKLEGHNMMSIYYMYWMTWVMTVIATAGYYFIVTKKELKTRSYVI